MNTPITAETVLPRPAEPLPTPALAAATRKLTDKLTDLFNMSEEAARPRPGRRRPLRCPPGG